MIALPMRDGKYVWAAYGGAFEWALVLCSCPNRNNFEFLRGTLHLAIEVIERGMISAENRFTGFDNVELAASNPKEGKG